MSPRFRSPGIRSPGIRTSRIRAPRIVPPRIAARAALALVVLLVCVGLACAFQISPAAKRAVFSSDAPLSYTLRVLNDERVALSVNVSAQGALAAGLTLEPASFTMSPEESERDVEVTLTAAQDALVPGDNALVLRVAARPAGAAQFGSQVALLHTILLARLYDGAYVEGSLRALRSSPGEPLLFTLSLDNKGQAGTDVTSDVTLRSPASETLGTVSLGSVQVGAAADSKLERAWLPQAPLPPGRYVANATYRYADHGAYVVRDSAATVLVGSPSVLLASAPLTASVGGIARFEMASTLSWNEPVDVAFDAALEDGAHDALVSSRSATQRLFPHRASSFPLFVEVPAVAPGDYTLVVTAIDMRSGERLSSSRVPLALTPASTGIIPLVTSSTWALPLLVLLLVLIVALAILFVRYRWRKVNDES